MTGQHSGLGGAQLAQQLGARLEPFGQQHVLRFWEQLDARGQERLAAQIQQLDLELLVQLHASRTGEPDWVSLSQRAEPPRAIRLQGEPSPFSRAQARACGEAALRAGRLAVILVAGGQGSRLGFPHPKGMYPIGPLSQRTLFEMHLDRLRAMARRFATSIPLYVMTSPATHAETVQFFAGHERFGLGADELRIFCQGTMPALDAQTGQLLLADRGALFLSPDGHGGALAALDASGCLADARQRGIDQLFYLQVDNPLVAICDPVFVGYHLLAESEMSSQVVAKQDPGEKVGNLVTIDGRMRVIEYSDLPADVARQRNADGSLRLWAGSIAVHVLDAAFLERAAHSHVSLPFHRALKTVPFVDAAGQLQHPAQPNAIKFERFIFDLLPSARNPLAFEVAEQEAFAPLKNAAPADKDTAAHVRAAIVGQHAGWLRAAGVVVEAGVPVEIHPLFAEGPEELRGRLRSPLRISEPTYFKPRE